MNEAKVTTAHDELDERIKAYGANSLAMHESLMLVGDMWARITVLQNMLRELCDAIDAYAPQDNAALNEMWWKATTLIARVKP